MICFGLICAPTSERPLSESRYLLSLRLAVLPGPFELQGPCEEGVIEMGRL